MTKPLKISLCLLTLILITQSLIATTEPSPKPKWLNYDLWREKLKKEMPGNAVRNILGPPLYTRKCGSGSETLFYQYMPKIVKDPEKGIIVNYPTYGTVILSPKKILKNGKPMYTTIVLDWSEPDWEKAFKGAYDEPAKPKKLKPIRKLQPFEKEASWQKLRHGLGEQAVRKILGEPTRSENTDAFKKKFYFALPYHIVEMEFWKGTLNNWSEPQWLLVEKYLYEEVKDEPEQKETKTVQSSEN